MVFRSEPLKGMPKIWLVKFRPTSAINI